MTALGTVLSVWAHPDDETYCCGGLMARAVRDGSRVVCVTATRGELGSTDPDRWPPGPELAEVRTAELAASLAELGVTEHIWLDYADGGCASADQDEAVRRVRAIAEGVGPDTVLTFGPDGMTGHGDHMAVSRWVTAAVAGTDARVHYATNTPGWLAQYRGRLDELGVYMGAEPPCTPLGDLSLHVQLEGDLLDAKLRAIRRQESQIAPLLAALGEDFLREGLAEEAFRR